MLWRDTGGPLNGKPNATEADGEGLGPNGSRPFFC